MGATSIPTITGAGSMLAGDAIIIADDTNIYVVALPGTIVLTALGHYGRRDGPDRSEQFCTGHGVFLLSNSTLHGMPSTCQWGQRLGAICMTISSSIKLEQF